MRTSLSAVEDVKELIKAVAFRGLPHSYSASVTLRISSPNAEDGS